MQMPDQNTSPDPVGEPNQPNATNVVEESVAKIPFPWFFFGSTLFMILSLLLLGIAIGGVGLVICSILFVVFVVAWVIQYFQDKGRLYCKECKRKYDFAEDVEYRQIGHRVKSYSYNPKGSEHQIMSREYFKLQIGCTCPNCEIKKEFKSEYVGRETFYDGGIKDHDPELEIEKFFRNGIGGSKLYNLIFVAIGVVLLGIAIALFATRVNDPKNYYGTYYAVQDQYAVLSLELKEDGTYTLIQDDLLGDMYDRHESYTTTSARYSLKSPVLLMSILYGCFRSRTVQWRCNSTMIAASAHSPKWPQVRLMTQNMCLISRIFCRSLMALVWSMAVGMKTVLASGSVTI